MDGGICAPETPTNGRRFVRRALRRLPHNPKNFGSPTF
jgi:hypothetical protein